MSKAVVLKPATVKLLNKAKSALYGDEVGTRSKFTDDDTIFLALKTFNEVHHAWKRHDSKKDTHQA